MTPPENPEIQPSYADKVVKRHNKAMRTVKNVRTFYPIPRYLEPQILDLRNGPKDGVEMNELESKENLRKRLEDLLGGNDEGAAS